MKLNTDCRHFRNDRPCTPHKEKGFVCESCKVYDPFDTRILIVKLDALGDVLRTTALLNPLKKAYPKSKVTWLTKPNAKELFEGNSFVDEVIFPTTETLFRLQTEVFDLVLNPDASDLSSQIATTAKGREKRGFVINDRGAVVPLSAAAESWYETGVNDVLKKVNRKTYQQLLLEVLGLPFDDQEIIWKVSEKEKHFGDDFCARHALERGKHWLVGMNTGASGRWKYKKWTMEGYTELIRRVLNYFPQARVLLYGGGEEGERNAILERIDRRVINTGTENTLREFGALVEICDVMITGDTMALHLATALKKPVLALFGPTSHHEIDIYGSGEKIFAKDLPCLTCYLSDCDVRPTCMDRITVDTVYAALEKTV